MHGLNLFQSSLLLYGLLGGVCVLMMLAMAHGAFQRFIRHQEDKTLTCAHCGAIGSARWRSRGSLMIEIVLWVGFFFPGLIYSLWRHSQKKRYCQMCGGEHFSSPAAPHSDRL